jgi:hypothetical protein
MVTAMINRNPEVDNWLQQYDNPNRELVGQIREFILSMDPRLSEAIKWQAPTFIYKGNSRLPERTIPQQGDSESGVKFGGDLDVVGVPCTDQLPAARTASQSFAEPGFGSVEYCHRGLSLRRETLPAVFRGEAAPPRGREPGNEGTRPDLILHSGPERTAGPSLTGCDHRHYRIRGQFGRHPFRGGGCVAQ